MLASSAAVYGPPDSVPVAAASFAAGNRRKCAIAYHRHMLRVYRAAWDADAATDRGQRRAMVGCVATFSISSSSSSRGLSSLRLVVSPERWRTTLKLGLHAVELIPHVLQLLPHSFGASSSFTFSSAASCAP